MLKKITLYITSLLLTVNAAYSEPDRPNIVILLSDDQAWTDYGFMDHPHIKTPHLDALAAQSVMFENGYNPTPLCSPSLASLITGQFAHKHRVTGNDPSPKYIKKKSPEYLKYREQLATLNGLTTLPTALKKGGYLSYQCGKFWNGSYQSGGFTHGMTQGDQATTGRHGDVGLTIGRETMQPIYKFVEHSISEKKPFFIWYAPFLPHTPHNPPERILKKYKALDLPLPVAKYYANCEWYDETCGQLIDHLKEKGQYENTIFVSLTDNGWIQDEKKSNTYADRSKQTPYEGGVRTPIFFTHPKLLKPSKRPENITSLDIFPTLLASANVEIPSGLPGINLLPSLTENTPIGRKSVYGEVFAHDMADIDDPKKSLIYRWCREGSYKLIRSYDGELNRYKKRHGTRIMTPQLFDLSKDPHEKQDISNQHPEIVKRLSDTLNQWYPAEE